VSCTEIDIALNQSELERVSRLVYQLSLDQESDLENWLHDVFMAGVATLEERKHHAG